jgi:uncharacterized protein (UPF0276 family)
MSLASSLGQRVSAPIPARAGVGLKPEHYEHILDVFPDVGWFEVHPENYMGSGGYPHHVLAKIRDSYPLSLHGVGLSIGAAAALDRDHLARLSALVSRYEPGLVSEHLAWSTHDGAFLNDLLPLPYKEATLDHVVRHVDQMQMALGRQVLIENPSTYVTFSSSEMSEVEFLSELAWRSGCGLLLDINNVFVSASNHGFDAARYVDAFPMKYVSEIHLAGYAQIADDDGSHLLIDAHDRAVQRSVWTLYERVISRWRPLPTLIEWDNEVPAWPHLHAEAAKAERIMTSGRIAHALPA